MRLLVPLVVLLLAAPLAAAAYSRSMPDAEGDQGSALGRLHGCRDPAYDVVESGFDIDEDRTRMRLEVADASASFSCAGDVSLPRRAVTTFHLYTEDYPLTGYYVAWILDEERQGREYVIVYDPRANLRCEAAWEDTSAGDEYSIAIATRGACVTARGVSLSYELHGPATYYGTTASQALAGSGLPLRLDDRFGNTFDA